MPRFAITLLAAACVTVPLAVGAAETPETPAFSEADANGDGVVTIEEAVDAGVPEDEARREDIDADGELSEADWKFVDMAPDTSTQSAAGGGSN